MVSRNIQKRPSGKYRARYRDDAGHEHAKHFVKKGDAQAWIDTEVAKLVRGDWTEPSAGKVIFSAFSEEWLAAQTFDDSTRPAVESRLRAHILPTFGDLEVRAIKPSRIQAWIRGRQESCAPRYFRVMLANLSSIFGAAVEDGLIARNPCASRAVRAPRSPQAKVIPWPATHVAAVITAHPDRWRAVPIVAAGCGLRQGEVFGLQVEDVDFLGRTVHVRHQIKLVGGDLRLAPPKGGKTRDVPLPEPVALALAEHLRQHPPVEGFVFSTRERTRVNRTYYSTHVWKPALRAAGVEPTRANGMHALRHWFASVQLEGGTSIRALAEYLGHSDPGFTLRTYTHLMPSSEDRARQAMEAALEDLADSLRTTAASKG
jgi:integrase